jgi:hypothetical protein
VHKARPPTQRLPILSTELSTNTALHSNLFEQNTKYSGWSAGIAAIDGIFIAAQHNRPPVYLRCGRRKETNRPGVVQFVSAVWAQSRPARESYCGAREPRWTAGVVALTWAAPRSKSEPGGES